MITAEFNPADQILYAKSKGEITINEFIDTQRKYLLNDRLPRKLKIMEVANESIVSFSPGDLALLKSKVEEVATRYISIRHAVIHNKPMNTAYAELFEEELIQLNYTLKVFYTEEAALRWLKF
jgi:hypothetical protein